MWKGGDLTVFYFEKKSGRSKMNYSNFQVKSKSESPFQTEYDDKFSVQSDGWKYFKDR
jgi:hypothetical protein